MLYGLQSGCIVWKQLRDTNAVCYDKTQNSARKSVSGTKGARMSQEAFVMEPVAHIRSDFSEKFGIPRQSGLIESLTARIVLTPECRDPEILRGIEDYDYLWLVWRFSANKHTAWHPTVRPPRLGGNTRMGVFATRSPFRPNPLGLSCVKLVGVDWDTPEGPVLKVAGADLLDGTPIYDIKPYLPYVDSHPDARGGFGAQKLDYALTVECPDALLEKLPAEKRQSALDVLAQDSRPAYQDDPQRVYGLSFAGYDIKFTVAEKVLTVIDITTQQ